MLLKLKHTKDKTLKEENSQVSSTFRPKLFYRECAVS